MPALLAAVLLPSATTLQASTTLPTKSIAATPDNTVMLTVFLKHDQSRPLSELKAQLAKQEFHKVFPPEGVEVVSWNITMGIGQVIVLRLPASRLAQVNLAIENTAWGVYKTEFFPTYDFMPIAQRERAQARQTGTAQ
ncbi:hypothetical protein CRN80_25220 [Pseudomonas sp. FDAARGOS_380]|jgi:hypothetical protein|uniref:DUF3303 domain-containing protein n=1 Tax=Pseudomonas lactis TaxID=1615674 RepID=A0A921T831_9PSED|nr:MULTISPECIES: hypothetical protein [Pseudomonas]ATN13825.1 hypothetical protein CRN80_25220 [Pseudomonas sp. FDAARGOS_380]NCE92856.1 hypothetical protein [Pseudomonas sp. L13]NMX28875.1 hypothetical protein [Pseudomonas sp. WS 5406]WLH27182.1 hypothetical protein PSH76_14895 [Pseudomonas sp. FP215]HJH19891.1 hypothetical protein [Pseudomonas lactis]